MRIAQKFEDKTLQPAFLTGKFAPVRLHQGSHQFGLLMNNDRMPTGIRRQLLVWLAFFRIGLWLLKGLRPWRIQYGRRRP